MTENYRLAVLSVKGKLTGCGANQTAIDASLTRRRRIISRRLPQDLRQLHNTIENALSDDHSRNRHPAITIASRHVIAKKCCLYKYPLILLIRIKNRFFTECMLMTAGRERRFDGNTLRT